MCFKNSVSFKFLDFAIVLNKVTFVVYVFQALGDGLTNPCWIVVNLWRKSKLKAPHLEKLFAWPSVLELKLKLFVQIKAPSMTFATMS